uniref:Uncharacterized protein n=1 Tax=Avena sativa TaxID=4498 RepID=A0ACD5XNL4_AVESA
MDPDFRFDPDGSDDEAAAAAPGRRKPAQSPWEFSAYAQTVAAEHASRRTTSIDEKISQALRGRRNPSMPDGSEDEDEDAEAVKEESGDEEDGLEESDDDEDSEGEEVDEEDSGEEDDEVNDPEQGEEDEEEEGEVEAAQEEEDTTEKSGTPDPSKFFASSEGASFTANSFLELNLSRPLIRACEALGYQKPTPIQVQEVALRSNPDIVVATPGRIIDHLRNSLSVGLEDLAILILDEADRLLELGFSVEINELIRMCPKRRQTMLFSATMTGQIDELVKLSLNKPVRLEADPSLKRPATLTEEVVRIRRSREANQEAVLLALCLKTFKERVIVFSGTKHSAHRLKIMFGLSGMKAAELHGNLTQAQRLEALEQFKKQEADILIATDIAARVSDFLISIFCFRSSILFCIVHFLLS